MIGIADIHCHIIPYVDDGAQQTEESRKLLEILYAQGVRYICCTPHLRKNMFETPDETIIEQYKRLKDHLDEKTKNIRFFLSREYFCDDEFIRAMEADKVFTLGNGNFLLTEFSGRYSKQQISDYVDIIVNTGYKPLIAHTERYPALFSNPDTVRKLIRQGAKVQVNAGSILGREGIRQAVWTRRLLKDRLVHVVASDAHDTEMRIPELDKAAAHLEKRYGHKYAEKLLRTNPLKILNIPRRINDGEY